MNEELKKKRQEWVAQMTNLDQDVQGLTTQLEDAQDTIKGLNMGLDEARAARAAAPLASLGQAAPLAPLAQAASSRGVAPHGQLPTFPLPVASARARVVIPGPGGAYDIPIPAAPDGRLHAPSGMALDAWIGARTGVEAWLQYLSSMQ